MNRLIIVSNRLPVTVRRRAGQPAVARSSGGVATGLGAYHAKHGGVWVGWPGSAEGWSPHQWAGVEADLTALGYQPIALSSGEVDAFYGGFSNGVLWPLCHYLLDRVTLDPRQWEVYCDVNRRFADETVRVFRPGDLIWVNDYHLMLVPDLVRRQIPDARIAYFHHIPFPAYELFRTLPWRRRLLEGLLGADVIGLHTDSYVRHLKTACRQSAGAAGAGPDVDWQGRRVRIAAYPMGIDAARFARVSERPATRDEAERIRHDAGGRAILLGVDRLDYTKGIPRRLLAFERLLQCEPLLRDRVRLIQVAVPSRGEVPAYRAFRSQVEALVGRINGQFGTVEAAPVHYLHRSITEERLVALYAAADVMIVSPLRDGMNLVAKEFVAARTDLDGVLILSEFAGSSEDLSEAVIVNPYDIEGFADAMLEAIRMDPSERRARMSELRQRVMGNQIEDWAFGFIAALADATAGTPPGAATQEADDAVVEHTHEAVNRAARVHLFVDYDGTLVPFADEPAQAVPDVGLTALLGQLAALPDLSVHIISGRDRGSLQEWFGDSGLSLWAEHGLWHAADGRTWQMASVEMPDLGTVLPALELATAQTPGSAIERKGGSVAWHYRRADPEAGPIRARELRAEVARLAGAERLDVIDGNMVVEFRPPGAHKGTAVAGVRDTCGPGDLILAIGDDVTDEDMFAVLRPQDVGINVGSRPSRAARRLGDWRSVRRLLGRIAGARARQPRAATTAPDTPGNPNTPERT